VDRSSKRVPTYKEVVKDEADFDHATDDKPAPNGQVVEDDEEFDDVVDNFESSYNFRFEEP
jgi:protein KRI1